MVGWLAIYWPLDSYYLRVFAVEQNSLILPFIFDYFDYYWLFLLTIDDDDDGLSPDAYITCYNVYLGCVSLDRVRSTSCSYTLSSQRRIDLFGTVPRPCDRTNAALDLRTHGIRVRAKLSLVRLISRFSFLAGGVAGRISTSLSIPSKATTSVLICQCLP